MAGHAQPDKVVVIDNSDALSLIGSNTFVLADTLGKMSLDEILLSKSKFVAEGSTITKFPSTHVTYWIKFSLQNETNEDLLLQVGNGWIAYADLYKPNGVGSYDSVKTGHFKPFDDREFKSNQLIFLLAEKEDTSPREYYVRLNSAGYAIEAPLYVGSKSSMFYHQQKYDWLVAIYVGAVLIMMCYNLIIFFSVRENSYIYYFLYLISVMIMIPYLNGSYPHFWLYRDLPELNYFFFTFISFNPLFVTLFIHSFLRIDWRKNLTLKISYVLCFVIILSGTQNFIAGITNNYTWWNSNATVLLATLYYLITLILLFSSFLKGVRHSRFLLIGWSIYIAGMMMVIGSLELGVIPFTFLSKNGLLFGSLIEIIMFSMALTDKMNLLKKEREIAQETALEQANENARIIREQNELLDRKVEERTLELNRVNKDLQEKKEYLEEIIHEKDGLMGVVAHDLISPLNGIKGFATLAKKDPQISNAMDTYVKMITKLSENGILLIRDLLTVAKEKTRLDSSDLSEIEVYNFFEELLQPFSISARQKGISFDVFLNLKQERIQTEPISLTRIFENLLSNAIKFTPIGGKVEVTVVKVASQFRCSIKDSGSGFSSEDKKKMYRKFQKLSAKPTNNEGSTGLGLSIVKILCNRLGANIKLVSEKGSGATFTVEFENYQKATSFSDTKKTTAQ